MFIQVLFFITHLDVWSVMRIIMGTKVRLQGGKVFGEY